MRRVSSLASQALSSLRSPLLAPVLSGVRRLHIHEYQSQELMRKDGIMVPDAVVTSTPSDAEKAAKSLGWFFFLPFFFFSFLSFLSFFFSLPLG